MTTNINKNIADIKSQTAINDSDIKTDETEPTLNDLLKDGLNNSNYMRGVVNVAISQKATINDIINAILSHKTALNNSKTKNVGYQNSQDITDNAKVTKRVYGWLTHYSHLRATDVKKSIEIMTTDNKLITNRADIKNECHIVDFKPLA